MYWVYPAKQEIQTKEVARAGMITLVILKEMMVAQATPLIVEEMGTIMTMLADQTIPLTFRFQQP